METFLVGCVVWVLEIFSHPLEGDGQEVKGVAQHSCSTARLAWFFTWTCSNDGHHSSASGIPECSTFHMILLENHLVCGDFIIPLLLR